MRNLSILILLFTLLAPLAGSAAAAQIPPGLDVHGPGILVQLQLAPGDEDSLRAALSQLAQAQGMELVEIWPQIQAGLLRPHSGRGGAAAVDWGAARQTLAAHPSVLHAEMDAPIYAADWLHGQAGPAATQDVVIFPDDPRRLDQYALDRVYAYAGWTISQGSPQVAVAVIDSGYDLEHEDILAESVWINQAEADGAPGVDDDGNGYTDDIYGWDWIDHNGVTNDPYGHGTHVGGVIGAATHNGVGVASMGRNLRVLPLRILDQYGRGSVSGLLSALFYAADRGVPIINLSLVTTTESATLRTAIQTLAGQGILIVAAAGNAGSAVSNFFPAAWPEVFTVAATDGADNVTLFSNYGPAIDVAAPGAAVLSTYRDNTYYLQSGTSMASPHVAALAGLIWSLRPDLSTAQVVDLIRATADDVNQSTYPGRDNYLGDGRINLESALWIASQGVTLTLASDGVLAAGQAGSLWVHAGAGADALPVAGAVVNLGLRPALDDPILLTDAVLSGVDGRAAITVTAPMTVGFHLLDLAVGQSQTSVPVYVYTAPLTLSLTAQNELTASSVSLPFDLRVANAAGPLPVTLNVRLTTNLGHFTNQAQEIQVQVTDGSYSSFVQGWSMVDLLNQDLRIQAELLSTGQTAAIWAPLQVYRAYFPFIPAP